MSTLNIKQDGDKLMIVIDTSKAARDAASPSASGKTRVLATTHGFVNYAGVRLSLNAVV
jgi:hypothetical protein